MALVFPAGAPGATYAAPNGVTYTWNNTLGVWTAGATTALTIVDPGYITGTANAAQVLNYSGYVAAGGTSPYTWTWVWKDSTNATLQTNGSTYTVLAGDVGKRIYITVTATDAASTAVSANTAYTDVVGSVFIDPFYTNTQTVASNYTLSTGYNAMSAGSITINSGVTVTIPASSTWTVV